MRRLNKGKNLPTKKLLKKTNNHKVLRNLAIACVITLLAAVLYIKIEPKTYEAKQRKQLEQTIQKTESDKKKLLDQVQQSGSVNQEQKKQIEELNKKLEETQKLVDAKRSVPKVYAAAPVSTGCNTGNVYKDYIYMHESSCNPASVNSIGCRGIGQACPGSKLPCGADFACQDAYFSNYAIQRYGSWQNAYAFWLANHWW